MKTRAPAVRVRVFIVAAMIPAIASVQACSADRTVEPVMAASGDALMDSSVTATAADGPILMVDAGFELPESVVHDIVRDVYLVSNLGGDGSDPLALDNNGFISRLAPDGTVLDLRWIEGRVAHPLHGPTGLAIVGDLLYAVDRDAVRAYYLADGASAAVYPAPAGASLLNDICAGPRGELYVTDTGLDQTLAPTGSDAVYRLTAGGFEAVAADATALGGPNGCLVRGGNVHWVTFFGNRILRTNASGSVFEVATLPGGQLDGIVEARGAWYVTSWEDAAVYRSGPGGGPAVAVVTDFPFPADPGYDATRHRLLVPSLFGNMLLIQPLGSR